MGLLGCLGGLKKPPYPAASAAAEHREFSPQAGTSLPSLPQVAGAPLPPLAWFAFMCPGQDLLLLRLV
jgi:hypothetical protein